jgi:hypothetical protein
LVGSAASAADADGTEAGGVAAAGAASLGAAFWAAAAPAKDKTKAAVQSRVLVMGASLQDGARAPSPDRHSGTRSPSQRNPKRMKLELFSKFVRVERINFQTMQSLISRRDDFYAAVFAEFSRSNLTIV